MKIIVEDNGVGRKEAMVNKKIKEGNEEYMSKSIATKILKERIDALNYLYKAKSEFYLEDVIKENKINGYRVEQSGTERCRGCVEPCWPWPPGLVRPAGFVGPYT